METEMRKLVETTKKITTIGVPNGQMILAKFAFIQYEQFLLAKKFLIISRNNHVVIKTFNDGISKTPHQKTYEMQGTSQDCNREFNRPEILLVCDKSDKHVKIYDSCNTKSATRMIKSVKLANISKNYSLIKTKR